MILRELIKDIEYLTVAGSDDIEVSGVAYDSRKVSKGDVFICIKGSNIDGHDLINDALEKGAIALVVSQEVTIKQDGRITVIKVSDTRYAMAFMTAAYFGNPASKLTTIGITGTKGKTTITYMVKSILEKAGMKVGLIGTIETIIGNEVIPSKNTTPESYVLQEYFAKMVEVGCDVVVMEVSSQGLMMHRTQGFIFDIGIFTNISPDHIGPNEHDSFEHYMECKSLLFKQCKLGIVNADCDYIDEVLKGHTCEVESFGFSEKADIKVESFDLLNDAGILGVSIKLSGNVTGEYKVSSPGIFSAYNALTAIAICKHFNIVEEKAKEALLEAKVKGRIELVPISDKFTLMIDYAHNAMALESLLLTLREYKPKRLVCLFGCGGNRAKSRRFEMGEVSGKYADLTIITSDNPRFESPESIIEDIELGMSKTKGEYVKIIDRREAIAYAIKNAREGDVIALAGKGHEDYQEIEGVKYPMDERDIIAEIKKIL